jgi:methionyl-tRNA formyltransferase
MRVVKALDAGPMLAAVRRPIGPDETSAAVERDLARLGAELLVHTIDRLAGGGLEEVPQDDAAATYAPRLTKDEGVIDWSRSARQIHDLVRGLHPWPHAFAFLKGERIIVHRSEVVETGAERVPGEVLSARGDEFVVMAGTGALRLIEVQIQGRRLMHARDFLAGHPVATGSVFGATP